MSTIVDKMETDYGKACAHLKATMKEKHFVHNLLDGTATEATVVKLGEMRTAYPNHKFGVVGRAGFEQRIFGLPESDIIALIGMAVSAEDTRNLRRRNRSPCRWTSLLREEWTFGWPKAEVPS